MHLTHDDAPPGGVPSDPAAASRLLCDAAEAGDADRMRSLLDRGVAPDGHWDPERARRDHERMNGHVTRARQSVPGLADLPDEMRAMLDASMDEHDRESTERIASAPWSHEIPLFRAARSGSAAAVRCLLEAGVDPHRRDDARHAAMYAATSPEIVRLLMDAGVAIEDEDELGWSPLVDALSDGEEGLERIEALLANGADANAIHDRGFTVLMSAAGATERRVETMRRLVEAGADPHAISDLGDNVFHAAIDVSGEANEESSVRSTLGYLRELGVDLEQRGHGDQTPLARVLEEGTAMEVRVLCELGANVHATCPLPWACDDEGGCTFVQAPLLVAAAAGPGIDRAAKTAILLDAGADPRATDAGGGTALDRAIERLCGEAEDPDASDAAVRAAIGAIAIAIVIVGDVADDAAGAAAGTASEPPDDPQEPDRDPPARGWPGPGHPERSQRGHRPRDERPRDERPRDERPRDERQPDGRSSDRSGFVTELVPALRHAVLEALGDRLPAPSWAVEAKLRTELLDTIATLVDHERWLRDRAASDS